MIRQPDQGTFRGEALNAFVLLQNNSGKNRARSFPIAFMIITFLFRSECARLSQPCLFKWWTIYLREGNGLRPYRHDIAGYRRVRLRVAGKLNYKHAASAINSKASFKKKALTKVVHFRSRLCQSWIETDSNELSNKAFAWQVRRRRLYSVTPFVSVSFPPPPTRLSHFSSTLSRPPSPQNTLAAFNYSVCVDKEWGGKKMLLMSSLN